MKTTQKSVCAFLGAAIIVLLTIAVVACGGKSTNGKLATSVTSGALPSNSWVVPVDVTASNGQSASQNDWSNFAWQTFVALNWPAVVPATTSGISGLPNTRLSIGASSSNQAMIPAVWQTFRSEANTMLAGASNPGAWATNPLPLPSSCQALTSAYPVSPGFQPMLLNMVSKFGVVKPSNSDEASGPPLIEQSGWYVTYDIRVDQSEYTFIQQNGYYNAATQQSVETSNGQLLGFPQTGKESTFNPPLPTLAQFGALEVKAAWRVLDPSHDKAIIPRYYTQSGYFLQQDGTTCQGPALFGLIGLHILRLTPTTPATWFWATFEQVDNVTAPAAGASATLAAANTPNGACTSQYNSAPPVHSGNIPWTGTSTPVNVCQVTNIASTVQQINTTWQGNLAGTVWANYQLIDTVNPSVQGGPAYSIPISTTTVNTNILANTTMETYLQGVGAGKGQSCMDCHSFATPQCGPKGCSATNPSNNQIFTFLLANADTPPSVTAVKRQKLPQNVISIIQSMRSRK